MHNANCAQFSHIHSTEGTEKNQLIDAFNNAKINGKMTFKKYDQ